MAYNPAMYQTYGSMYGNSYGQYPQGQASMTPAPAPVQNYAPAQTMPVGMIWVDGEVGAKAQQMPAGWPVNTPLPLWDTNDTIIYLKSTNQMGMPNPLQKLKYTMEENIPKYAGNVQNRPALMSGDSAGEEKPEHDMSDYVRKEDLRSEGFAKLEDIERMKRDLMESISSIGTGAQGTGNTAKRTVKGE